MTILYAISIASSILIIDHIIKWHEQDGWTKHERKDPDFFREL